MKRLGSYLLEAELGRGGMGAVFRGRDPRGAEVAIKVLWAQPGERQLQRFQREARALGRLRHPGLVGLLDAGVEEGRPDLVLPLVQGGSLEDRLRRAGPLEPGAAVALVAEVAGAVEAAHQAGVLHRDLKPENVLLDEAGRPRLTDFGLALELAAEHSRLTQSGTLLGTPGYMSPEQLCGELERVGPATDVHGLGGLLYACLSGGPPYRAPSLPAMIDATVERPPAPLDVDPGLEAICLRCLAKEPGQRYASAAEVEAALRAWRPGLTSRGAPAWLLLAGVLAAAAGAGAVVVLGGSGPDAEEAKTGEDPGADPAEDPADDPAEDPGLDPEAGDPDLEAGDPAGSEAGEDDEEELDPERLLERAERRVRLVRFDDAERVARRVLRRYPEAPRAWLVVAEVALNRSEPQAGLEAVERGLAGPSAGFGALDAQGRAHGLALRAWARFELDDPTAALMDVQLAQELDPEQPLAGSLQATIHLYGGNTQRALERVEDVLVDYPDHVFALATRCHLRARTGDFEGVLADAARVQELQPGQLSVLLDRMLAHAQRGDPAAAVADADAFLALAPPGHPGRGEALANRGLAHMTLGDPAAGLRDVDEALALDPGDADLRFSRGNLRAELGDLGGALTDYDRVAAARPRWADLFLNRGLLHSRRGERSAAADDLRRFLELAPDDPEAGRVEDLLRDLEGGG